MSINLREDMVYLDGLFSLIGPWAHGKKRTTGRFSTAKSLQAKLNAINLAWETAVVSV